MIVSERVKALAHGAACAGQEALFTRDARDVRAATLRAARAVCQTCPVFALCEELRDEINPTAGIWAGQKCSIRTARQRGAAL